MYSVWCAMFERNRKLQIIFYNKNPQHLQHWEKLKEW